MDDNEAYKNWKQQVNRRLSIIEAAIFSKPAGDLPVDLHDEKEKKNRPIKESKIIGYIDNNDVSKSELSLLATKLGLSVSSIYPKEEMIEAILNKTDLNDPIQEIRDRTKIFISENNIALSTVKCDLKCATCPESRVVLCQLYNKELIENHFEE